MKNDSTGGLKLPRAGVCAISLGALMAACGSAEVAPDASPDVTADVTPDASPDVTADVVPDASEDAVIDAQNDAAGDAVSDAPEAPLVWQRCFRTFFCTDVSVPLDWSRPTGPRVTIGVLRAPARRAAERVGVLMVNYGGPGTATEEQVAGGYPNVLGGALGASAADLFDIVAVDWRGLGRSTPSLGCGIVRNHDPLAEPDSEVESDAGWAVMVTEQMRVQRECTARVPSEFLARVSSDDAARDMDYVRARLGEERVNFVGYSYGTRLAASYIALFPSHVRAFVLDSPVAPGLTQRDFLRGQARGGLASLDRFTAWCAATPACTFRGPETTSAGVRGRLDALIAAMDRTPYTVGKRRASGYVVEIALSNAGYSPGFSWRTLGVALASAQEGDAAALLRIVDGAWPDDGLVSGYFSIMALDYPPAADESLDSFRSFFRTEIAAISPHAGRALVSNVAIVGWPARRPTPAVSVRTPTAPPAMVIGSRADPATPYEWAPLTRDALGNGSHLITYEGAGHAMSTQIPCLADIVRGFLLDPSAALLSTTCPAVDP